MALPPLLEMRGIRKAFHGVPALAGVDLTVARGEVHLLLGENGAGKSTLMKILAGAHRADDGTIRLDGRDVAVTSPLRARELGIAMIHQELNLVPHLSVAENIFLGREPARFGFVLRRRMEHDAAVLLRRMRAGISPAARVADLPIAQRQLVEICKALSLRARLIIMDEPTSPLTRRETDSLFALIRTLARAGTGIIYITHRLEEARAIGRRVTVLRDGRVAGCAPLRRLASARLVRMMVGRSLSRAFPPLAAPGPREVLRVDGLARSGGVGPASFTLRAGEILGVAGLIGAGRTELARCLVGADPATAGAIRLDGRPVTIRSPRDARAHGICLLPEDRKAQGLVLGLPVLQNISLASLPRFSRFGFLRTALERRVAGGWAAKLRIRGAGLDAPAQNLSGGNQQKVVLARWLGTEPRVLIFDEPTRGIDVGARLEVYRLIAGLARRGAAILLMSSDLPEVLGMAHRVAVMRGGRIAGMLPRRTATPERVMRLAMGLARA